MQGALLALAGVAAAGGMMYYASRGQSAPSGEVGNASVADHLAALKNAGYDFRTSGKSATNWQDVAKAGVEALPGLLGQFSGGYDGGGYYEGYESDYDSGYGYEGGVY